MAHYVEVFRGKEWHLVGQYHTGRQAEAIALDYRNRGELAVARQETMECCVERVYYPKHQEYVGADPKWKGKCARCGEVIV